MYIFHHNVVVSLLFRLPVRVSQLLSFLFIELVYQHCLGWLIGSIFTRHCTLALSSWRQCATSVSTQCSPLSTQTLWPWRKWFICHSGSPRLAPSLPRLPEFIEERLSPFRPRPHWQIQLRTSPVTNHEGFNAAKGTNWFVVRQRRRLQEQIETCPVWRCFWC